ncbi:MAG: hypothetical protein ACI9TY_001387 [Alphaproteobacteria bacterium]|jgi:hypothetical protein
MFSMNNNSMQRKCDQFCDSESSAKSPSDEFKHLKAKKKLLNTFMQANHLEQFNLITHHINHEISQLEDQVANIQKDKSALGFIGLWGKKKAASIPLKAQIKVKNDKIESLVVKLNSFAYAHSLMKGRTSIIDATEMYNDIAQKQHAAANLYVYVNENQQRHVRAGNKATKKADTLVRIYTDMSEYFTESLKQL